MDFSDKVQELAARIPKQRELITTEEATKNAFVLPFISALGYDVFNPSEVTPELVTDVGGNNRKPICRFHFNAAQKYVGLFDEAKNEERMPIERLDEIYQYADRLRETVGYYD